MVDHITGNSTHPPIIIIQADHGSAHTQYTRSLAKGAKASPVVEERLAILNAMLVPARYREKLYPGISPVNTFRLILSEQFGESLELLEDRHFFSLYGAPQQMVEISERLKQEPLDRKRFEASLAGSTPD